MLTAFRSSCSLFLGSLFLLSWMPEITTLNSFSFLYLSSFAAALRTTCFASLCWGVLSVKSDVISLIKEVSTVVLLIFDCSSTNVKFCTAYWAFNEEISSRSSIIRWLKKGSLSFFVVGALSNPAEVAKIWHLSAARSNFEIRLWAFFFIIIIIYSLLYFQISNY